MAGGDSRFDGAGFDLPKPLIPLLGRPLFWWATESLRRRVPLQEMIFVILKEHGDAFNLDRIIISYYPEAVVVEIPEVTADAVESAMIGVRHLTSRGPVAINDCDHAFEAGDLALLPGRLVGIDRGGLQGASMCFPSNSLAYSYADLEVAADGRERVIRAVENSVSSDHAIGGCYFFASSDELDSACEDYSKYCPDDALFMHGIISLLIRRQRQVGVLHAGLHRAFGTPDDLLAMSPARFAPLLAWK